MPDSRRRALRVGIPAAAVASAAVAWILVSLSAGTGPPLTAPVCRGDVVAPKGLSPPSPAERGSSRPASLDLGLAGDGAVQSIRVGDRSLPFIAAGGGFSIRKAGGGSNLIQNSSFEHDANGDGVPDGWAFSGAGGPRLDSAVGHSGTRSVRVVNPEQRKSGTFRAEVSVEPNTHYVFSGWFRGRDIRPLFPTAIRESYQPHSPFKVDVQQLAGGRVVGTASAWAYTGTAGWHRQFAGLRTRGDVTALRLSGWIEDGSGTGWFDDLHLAKLFPSGPVTLRGTVSEGPGGRSVQRATLSGTGLSLNATFTAARDHVRVDGSVEGNEGGDSAFQLSYTLPVDATGWEWGDFARGSRPIERGEYAYLSTGSSQRVSRYPWSVIHDGASALAIGVPLDQPRVFRVAYDTSTGLSVTFDLGISPDATALRGRATFSFIVYTADPAWGFRSATQRYFELFPQFFQRRTNPACEGAWFVAPPLDSIARTYPDFGLGLNMVALGKASSQSHATWGTSYIRWDNRRRIATTAYTHQWAFYDPVPRGAELPYHRAIARLEAEARRPPSGDEQRRLRNEAAAALVSTQRDYNGRLRYERFGAFYAYYQNLDEVNPPLSDWAATVQVEQVERAIDVASTAGGRLNGIHLDSTSGMRRWGAADDYDRRHWAAARIPLTFSYDSGLVTVRGIFPLYGRIGRVAAFVRDRGMMLTANFNAAENQALGFVGADHIDFFGLEQGLIDRARPGMSADRFAMVKRSLAYQRPVSTLDHKAGQGTLDAAEIERRLQQNLFYGMFSGAFDAATEAEATGGVTWSTPQNAVLWARYTPLIKEVATAGWHPVTNARSSNSFVWVERFGSFAARNLHLTLRNETKTTRRLTLTIDLRALGAEAVTALRAVEKVTGGPIAVAVDRSRAVATLTASIPAMSTRLLLVSEGV